MERKNFLFSNTPAGAQASAVIYKTAKENGLDPCRYLNWVFHEAPKRSLTDDDWTAALIPAKAPDFCKLS